MYLVMGITGKVGGATARHLLKQGKQDAACTQTGGRYEEHARRAVLLLSGLTICPTARI